MEIVMYSGKSIAVELPKALNGGRLITLSNGYVYYVTEFKWDKVKRRTVDNRVSIGKIDPNNKKMMFPGKRYYEFFGDKRSDVDSFYFPLGRTEAGSFDFVLSYGPYVVLKKCFELCGGSDALNKSMPRLSAEITALAIHAIVAENSRAQDFPYWAFDNYCGLKNPISDSTVSRIYREIAETPACINLFFEYYQELFHKTFPCSKNRVVAFDSTNQVTESHNQTHAYRGKSKTGEKLPIICTAMFVDEKTGISLWYEHFDGNVLDKSETPYSIEKATQLGFKKLFAMFDRGYYSLENVSRLKELGIEYGMMMPETVNLVTDTLEKWRSELRLKEVYYIPEEDIYGVQTTVKLPNGEMLPAYVYYDDHTATDERNSIHGKVKFFMNEAEERTRYSEKMREYFSKRAIIVTKLEQGQKDDLGRNFTLKIDTEQVQKANDEAGYFMILSNTVMTAKDMICIARNRDCVEKGFKDLKSHFDLARTYTHSDATYSGKMFVAFIALIIIQTFRYYEQSLLHLKTAETVATLIAELRKYKIQEKKDHTWMPVYAMNKKQKSIIDAVSLNEDLLEKNVRQLKIERL